MNRLDRLRESLKEKGADAFFLHDPINLYYYTGHEMSAGKLLVTQESALLLVDGRYFEAVSGGLIDVELEEKGTLERHLKEVKSLGFDSRLVDVDLYQRLSAACGTLIPLPGHLMEMRAVKEVGEIDLLRKAAALAGRGYDYVAALLDAGVQEIELARKLEIFWLEEGGEKLSFDPIIAFGANSALPHYHTGEEVLKEGAPALFDMGVQLGRYQSDMTRVRFLGTPDEKMEKIYSIVREAFDAAVAICRPGVSAGELDGAAREVISAAGFGEQFTHSLGHGVGLEVHEFPVLRAPSPHGERRMEAGMVITIEPGIYLPGVGGVRLEDTLVITEEGCESLTQRAM